jgi:hypothetical protein
LLGVVLLASGLGLLGFLRTVHTELARRIGLVAFLVLALVVLIAGDVYVMNAVPAMACVPWILFFASRKQITIGMAGAFCLTGLISETANFFRSHAGTAVLLFALLAAAGVYAIKPRARVLLATVLLLSALSPQLLFRELYARRNVFLANQPGAASQTVEAHPFWHSVYVGLSYVKNSEIPAYRDEIAFAKVKSLRPEAELYSPEYEQVLRQETFRLAERRPLLILANLVVKVLVVLLFCVCAANVGLYCVSLARKPIWLEMAFCLAIGFNGLYGILVLPNPKYLVGLISFATLYGVYSLEFAAANPDLHRRFRWLEKLVFIRANSLTNMTPEALERPGEVSGLPIP